MESAKTLGAEIIPPKALYPLSLSLIHIWEKYMRDMIQCFPNNQIIIFPQSLFYTKSELGEAERKNTAAIFDSHPDLTLALRDQNAYQEAKKMFRRTKLCLLYTSHQPFVPVMG